MYITYITFVQQKCKIQHKCEHYMYENGNKNKINVKADKCFD